MAGEAERERVARILGAHRPRSWRDRPGELARRRTSARASTSLDELADAGSVELVGRVGVGAGLIRLDGDPRRQAAAVERLRSCGVFGNVVVVRATASLKRIVDVWGPQPNRSTFES